MRARRAWPWAAYSRSARAGRGPENPDFVGAGAPDVPRAADSRNGRAARGPEKTGFVGAFCDENCISRFWGRATKNPRFFTGRRPGPRESSAAFPSSGPEQRTGGPEQGTGGPEQGAGPEQGTGGPDHGGGWWPRAANCWIGLTRK